MQTIPIGSDAVRVVGALGLERSSTAVTPCRLPAAARDQIVDPFFGFAISAASGVHLAFTSEADEVELDALLTGIDLRGLGLDPPPPCFDLAVDGEVVAACRTDAGNRWVVGLSEVGTYSLEFRTGQPTTVRF